MLVFQSHMPTFLVGNVPSRCHLQHSFLVLETKTFVLLSLPNLTGKYHSSIMEDPESIEFTNRSKGSANTNIKNVQLSGHEARGFTSLQTLDVSLPSETYCQPFLCLVPTTSALAFSAPGRSAFPSLELIFHRDTLIFSLPLLLERIC